MSDFILDNRDYSCSSLHVVCSEYIIESGFLYIQTVSE